MKPKNQQPSESPTGLKPDPEFIGQQLQQPSGDFAPEVGQMVNYVSKSFYYSDQAESHLKELYRII